MSRQSIVMNFTVSPSLEDIEALAADVFDALPAEISRLCENLALQVEEFPDATIEHEMELDDSYDLIALFRGGGQIAPGVTKKVANDDDVLILYRRPLLDMWCETGEDLGDLVRRVMIEELGENFEFSPGEIEEMAQGPARGAL